MTSDILPLTCESEYVQVAGARLVADAYVIRDQSLDKSAPSSQPNKQHHGEGYCIFQQVHSSILC